MTTKAILEKQIATLEKEIDILSISIDDLHDVQSAIFTANKLYQERVLLHSEMIHLKAQLRDTL